MHLVKYFLLFLITLFSSKLYATTANSDELKLTYVLPIPINNFKTCLSLFEAPKYQPQILKRLVDGPKEQQDTLPGKIHDISNKPPESESIFNKIMDNWLESGHYNQNQINLLRSRDQSLPQDRTHYIEFEQANESVGLRVLDASDLLFYASLPAADSSTSSKPVSLIETLYQFDLPERVASKQGVAPAYIWELGLLSAPHFFQKGIESIFFQVAYMLDFNYNQSGMMVFRSTEQLEKINLQIYGISRRKLVPKYQELGFEVVTEKDEKGQTVEKVFPDGMVLIKISGANFLKKHFLSQTIPASEIHSVKRDPKYLTDSDFSKKWYANMRHLKTLRFEIKSQSDLENGHFELQRRYQRLLSQPNFSQAQWDAWRDFIEFHYVLWNSIPKSIRPQEWDVIQLQLTRCLSLTYLKTVPIGLQTYQQLLAQIPQIRFLVAR